jgi:DNA polymerase III subunit beta
VNILISSTKLASTARIVALAASTNQRNELLKCCKLTAGDGLSIYGTDLDTGIAAVADCDVIEPGEAVVDAEKLADIGAKLRGDVRIEAKAGELTIKCGRSRFALTMQPVEDYPADLAIDAAALPIELTAADILAAFAGAAAGAARDDRRIYLAGPVLFSENSRLCGVGADSVVLSYAATAAPCPELAPGIIVHRDTCKLAAKLFGDTGAVLRVGNSLIELASDRVRLTAKLVDSTPTAWRSMVPADDISNAVSIERARLVTALERCGAVYDNLTGDAAKQAPIVGIRWDAGDGTGDVTVSYGELSLAPAALDIIGAEALHGTANISINPRLLLRLLDGLSADEDGCDIIMLQAGERPGDPLRVNAGENRFVVLGQMRDFSHIEEEAA